MTQRPRDQHPTPGEDDADHLDTDRPNTDRADTDRPDTDHDELADLDDLLQLQHHLQSALHEELHAGRIDEASLHAGTRHQLRRRIQHRRRTRAVAGAFTLAAVIALPLGLHWSAEPSVRTVPAASLTPTPTGTPTQTPVPTAAQTPAQTAAGTSTLSKSPASTPSVDSTAGSSVGLANPDVPVAYDIPDMTRTRAALPAGLVVLGDRGQYPKSPTVMGQACSSRPFDPPMVAGRQITWWNEIQRWPNQASVDLVVTGRATGGGPIAFDALVANTGVCRFTDPTTPFAITVAGADQTWAAHTDSNGLPFVSGAARVGDLIVGITVLHPAQDAVSELTTLLTAAVADLRASGLPAAEGR